MTLKEHLKNGIGINNFGHANNDMYMFIIPMILPLLKLEFNLSYVETGLILTAHIGVRSLFSYISGHLGDIYDKRIIISAGFLLTTIFLVGLIFVDNVIVLVIFLMLMAIGIATFHPLATALVGEIADPDYRGFHIGLFEATGSIGIILTTFIFGLLVGNWGWRYTVLLLSLPGIPLAWAYLKSKKEEIDTEVQAEISVDRFYILMFILGRGVRSIGNGAIFSFLPAFATDQLGISPGRASWLVTVMFLGNILGGPGSGWLSDKKNPLLIISISTLLAMPVVLGMTLSNSIWLVGLLCILLGVLNGGFFTPQNLWLTTVSTAATRGKVMGAAFLIDGISVTVAPTIYGWIADQIGMGGAFRWTLLPIGLSLIFFVKMYDLHRREQLEFRVGRAGY